MSFLHNERHKLSIFNSQTPIRDPKRRKGHKGEKGKGVYRPSKRRTSFIQTAVLPNHNLQITCSVVKPPLRRSVITNRVVAQDFSLLGLGEVIPLEDLFSRVIPQFRMGHVRGEE